MSAAPTIDIDLGPRALAPTPDHPFALSAGEVRAIGTYVGEVRVVWDAVPDFRIPAELRDMVAACHRWDDDTFPRIRDMADSIADYGSRTAPRRYGELRGLLSGQQADPKAGARAASILEELTALCRRQADGSLSVVQSVGAFSEGMSRGEEHIRRRLRERTGRPIESWEDLLWKVVERNRSNPGAALRATQKVWGVWQSLYTDLSNVRDTTARALSAGAPFLLRANIDLAIKQWKDLGDGAWAFRTSIAPEGASNE